jgi:hypothetical protein
VRRLAVFRDALEPVLTAVLEGEARASQQVVGGARHAHVAASSEREDPRRVVDGDPTNVTRPDFDLARMDAGAEAQAEMRGLLDQACGGANGPLRAVEQRDHAISRRLDQPTALAIDLELRSLVEL